MDWLIPILVGVVIVGLVGVIWRTHEWHDKERNEAIWDQIGRDGESGMRRNVHMVPGMSLRIDDQERRIERIERLLNGQLRGHDER